MRARPSLVSPIPPGRVVYILQAPPPHPTLKFCADVQSSTLIGAQKNIALNLPLRQQRQNDNHKSLTNVVDRLLLLVLRSNNGSAWGHDPPPPANYRGCGYCFCCVSHPNEQYPASGVRHFVKEKTQTATTSAGWSEEPTHMPTRVLLGAATERALSSHFQGLGCGWKATKDIGDPSSKETRTTFVCRQNAPSFQACQL